MLVSFEMVIECSRIYLLVLAYKYTDRVLVISQFSV